MAGVDDPHPLVLSLLARGLITAEDAETLLGPRAERPRPRVALLGTAVRLPGVGTPAELWRAISTGASMVSTFPVERFDLVTSAREELAEEFRPLRELLPADSRSFGGWLRGIERFEPEAFGLSEFEAQFLGPYERLMLQLAEEALTASGLRWDEVRGTRTGVYLAHQPSGSFKYLRLFEDPDERVYLNSLPANVAYQLAYRLDLGGPVMNVDTTCSSSLTALHLARRAVQSGECDLAVVAGISLNLFPFVDFEGDGFVLSPDHRCKSYDARADGIVWGEGGAAVVLKRLDEAERDGNAITAVLAGSAVVSEGSSNGMAAPNPRAHAAAVRAALTDAGLSADQIGYVEGHGAGTALGDMVEADALTAAFRADTDRSGYCHLGSVKSVAGHLGDAAGLAGLLSAVTRLTHRELPPVAGLERPNPNVDWPATPFVLNTETASWPAPPDGAPRRAGVSSLGISGTDVHVIVEEYQPTPARSGGRPVPVLLSARTRWSLWELVRRLAESVDPSLELAEIAATFARREMRTARIGIFAEDTEDLVAKLRRLLTVRAFERIPDYFYAQRIYVGDYTEIAEESVRRLAEQPVPAEDADLMGDFLRGADVSARYRAATGPARPVPLPVAPPTERRIWPSDSRVDTVDVSEFFFGAQWSPAPSVEPAPHGGISGLVVVFSQPSDDVAEHICDQLRDEGADPVLVRAGTGFAEHGADRFEIAPDEPRDYDRLWDALGGRTAGLRGVIHTLGLAATDAMADLRALDLNQRDGVYSLFHLARSIQRLALDQPLVLAVVSAAAQQVVDGDGFDPARVTSFGFARVFSQEQPGVAELSIDHDLSGGPLRVAEQIVAEFAADPRDRLPLVAYRAGARHAKSVRRRAEGGGSKLEIRPGGTYVIAGGTGNLGPQVARFLGENGAGTVVLLSRTGLPPRDQWARLRADGPADLAARLTAIELAEQTGVRVLPVLCDITKPEAVESAFARIGETVGEVHGGFMLAKQLFHLWVSELDFARFREGIENRVHGTWLLARKLQALHADFLVLFSSISSLSGTKGAAECASVNQYLDAISPYLTERGLPTYTLNLTLVLEDKSDFVAKTPIPPIDYTEFHGSLRRFARDAHGFDLVAKLDLEEVNYLKPVLRIPFADEVWEEAARYAAADRRGEDAEARGDDQPAENLHGALAAAWRATLGVEHPGDGDHFFNAGGTSLSAIRFVHLLGRTMPDSRFDVADLYACPTFAAQLEYLGRQLKPEQPIGGAATSAEDDVDDIFARVERGELVGEQAAELLAALPHDRSARR